MDMPHKHRFIKPQRWCASFFRRNQFMVLALTLTSIVLSGCGRGHELDTAEVQGIVTFDGKPLEEGFVTFVPTRGRGAMGVIQADGSYTLTTYRDGDGALIGPHTVTVSPRYAKNEDDEVPAGARMVPRPYGGIAATVEPGKVNKIDLNVTSSP
jgi:hypothetical protein